MEIDYAPEFKRSVKKLMRRYRSIRSDLEPLIEVFKVGKTPGDPLPGVDCRAYKVRLQNRDNKKGKSGGYRVVYYLKRADNVVLITMYSKSLQSDIAADDLQRIVAKYESSVE
ncbi:MAG: mRNA-degrading endonuclease RelE of RelBE toxin-antitoxin system [Flavobacteriales bacterium]|jgi:mRNA-degrading endonuclease RelE of RelBE toxin-antitoxin system